MSNRGRFVDLLQIYIYMMRSLFRGTCHYHLSLLHCNCFIVHLTSIDVCSTEVQGMDKQVAKRV